MLCLFCFITFRLSIIIYFLKNCSTIVFIYKDKAMPIPYYNTSPPTASNKNNITDIAITYGIRDFLLNKNLAPVYPLLSTSLNGSPRIGEPVLDTMVGTGNITQPYGLPLETEGILRMAIAVLPNEFKNKSSTAQDLVSIEDISKVNLYPMSEWPYGVLEYPRGATEEVYEHGIMGKTAEKEWRKKASIKNLYVDVDKQYDAADWLSLQPADITQNIKGYLDVYGGLNLGGSPGIQAASVIGSVLNGQGLGLTKGGVVTNFDLRSSLAGRVLGAAGVINDTKLGMIGGQQLALALANNAAFNIQQQALGALNVQDNVLSLVKNGTLAGFRPNYQITVPAGNGGKVLDYTAKILGFTLPKSYLQDAGSIFQDENGNAENIKRANSMILNTGKGQVVALLRNVNASLATNSDPKAVFRSGYAPAYADNKGQVQITDGILYAFNDGQGHLINPLIATDGVIPDMTYLREKKVEDSGFNGLNGFGGRQPQDYSNSNIKNPGFSWTTSDGNSLNSSSEYDVYIGDKKSLLSKTQTLFNSKGMLNIVSVKGDMGKTASQLQTGVVGGGISHGNPVMKKESFTANGRYDGTKKSAEETYCRSWTTFSRYDTVSKLVRSSGLDENAPYRNQMLNSTLDNYGFPKIAPYITDSKDSTDPKNFMFSIENLAWADNWQNLLKSEVGPGDLLTGTRGRIMWFPPYNIQFNESSSVSWESNNFIGRGESVYTYNNTERSGTLSFQIVVDHASYVNSFRGSDGPDDHYVASYFAGCVPLDSKFTDKLTIDEVSSIVEKPLPPPQISTIQSEVPPSPFSYYFPNDYADILVSQGLGSYGGYESGLSGTSPTDKINYDGTYESGFGIDTFVGGITSDTPWTDNHNYGWNGWFLGELDIAGVKYVGIKDPTYFPALKTYLETECPSCVLTIDAYASPQGTVSANEKISTKRMESMYNLLKTQLFGGKKEDYIKARLKKGKNETMTSKASNCIVGVLARTDTIGCKFARRASVTIKFDPTLSAANVAPASIIDKTTTTTTVNNKIKNRLYNETKYFEQLTDKDEFVFDKFRDKIRYFHPAFHSTTPEGLNSRLTFLQQCTRQGPTTEGFNTDNLSFGRPPVCILRIGDFYNTKIIIDNIAIDYEPLVWDLNPEGIGVQPMIANVSLSFKFIGGSTLMGPINKLQNALSFNYYANAQVYDPRADYIAKVSDISKSLVGKETGLTVQVSLDGKYALLRGISDVNELIDPIKNQSIIVANAPISNQAANNDAATSGAAAIEQKPDTTGFTLDNISVISDIFDVASSSHFVGITLALKVDGSNNVIIPTNDYQIDVSLIHAMQPKDAWSTDSLLNVCASDLVDKSSFGSSSTLINTAMLKPDGFYLFDSSGKNNKTDYTKIITLQLYPKDTPQSKGAILNAINQGNGVIQCNIKIQDAKPAGTTKIYDVDKGFRLKLEIKDLKTGASKSIILTKMTGISN